MLDRRDPEYQQSRRDRHQWLDIEFLAGRIGEATYLRSLFIIGYLPDEARTELARLRA